jgi:hypothetical protein
MRQRPDLVHLPGPRDSLCFVEIDSINVPLFYFPKMPHELLASS